MLILEDLVALIYGAGDNQNSKPFWFSTVTRGWNDVPLWGYESRLTNPPYRCIFFFHVKRFSFACSHCIIVFSLCRGKFLRDCINEKIHSDKSHNFSASPVRLAGSKAVSYFNRPSKGAGSAVEMSLERKCLKPLTTIEKLK